MLTLIVDDRVRPPADDRREVFVWRDECGRAYARAFANGDRRWIEWRGLGVFAFFLHSTTVFARPTDGVDLCTVSDAFARIVQPIILQALGRQALHASGVQGVEGVLAFCGVGRSGKSTVAYALSQDGYQQVADDVLVIEPQGPSVVTYLLPFVPSIRRPSQQHFAAVGRHFVPDAKAPTSTASSVPLRLAFILRQDDTLQRVQQPQRIPPAAAFSALVTHAHCFDETDPTHTRQLVDAFLQVAENVPVFSVTYPPRFAEIAQLTEAINAIAKDFGITRRHTLRPALIP